MGRPLRMDEVRGVEYLPIADQPLHKHYLDYWGEVTHIAPCSFCGSRMAEDRTRNMDGSPIPEEALPFKEELLPACERCIEAGENARVVSLLESKLGLSERDRDALRAFIETVFTDPQKILQVKDLHNRVGELERQNGRLWTALGIVAGLVAISIAGVVGIALALAS